MWPNRKSIPTLKRGIWHNLEGKPPRKTTNCMLTRPGNRNPPSFGTIVLRTCQHGWLGCGLSSPQTRSHVQSRDFVRAALASCLSPRASAFLSAEWAQQCLSPGVYGTEERKKPRAGSWHGAQHFMAVGLIFFLIHFVLLSDESKQPHFTKPGI